MISPPPATPELELQELIKRCNKILEFISEQAKDEALWSQPIGRLPTISEAYLQHALRGCHAFIESVLTEGVRP